MIDGKKYEMLKNEPLEQMSDDMFNFFQEMIEKRKQKKAKKELIHYKKFRQII